MNKNLKIVSIDPPRAIPDGEITIACEIGSFDPIEVSCLFDGIPGYITACSSKRILVRVPEALEGDITKVVLLAGEEESQSVDLATGVLLADGLHNVANPAVDPSNGSIVVTVSGSRGQQIENTLFRIKGSVKEKMDVQILNPTGLAFDSRGRLFVSNRADGEVYRVENDFEAIPYASGLGVATGIAFDSEDRLFVGDRSGKIFEVSGYDESREWAQIEPSVSAFHIAFGKSGDLFASAPGLCSYDVVHRIDPHGETSVFYKGLGRPQGLAFDSDGNLYVAACLRGRHGIVKISEDGFETELWLAGMNVVGLCFDDIGGLIVATSDSVFRLRTDVGGLLLK